MIISSISNQEGDEEEEDEVEEDDDVKLVRLILWLIPLAVPSLEVYFCDHERCFCPIIQSVIEHVVCKSVLTCYTGI